MLTEEGTIKVLSSAKETLGIKTSPGKWTSLPLPSGLRIVDVHASQAEVCVLACLYSVLFASPAISMAVIAIAMVLVTSACLFVKFRASN